MSLAETARTRYKCHIIIFFPPFPYKICLVYIKTPCLAQLAKILYPYADLPRHAYALH